MDHREDEPLQPEMSHEALFVPAWPQYDNPDRIVTLGHYYPRSRVGLANDLVRETRSSYSAGAVIDPKTVRRNLHWTRLINALTEERQWPIKRLFAMLDAMLEPAIAIAVVPTHLAYQAFWPVRTLARQLAEHERIDATSCLVRHTTIRRITFGGPSTKALHRLTVRVENPHLVSGRRVLLLDDIAKSGASLMACREMLYEAGAATVQAMAIGRVIVEQE